jgi:radical SAM superfamily enzyme YgiQ (UPF0313 family)
MRVLLINPPIYDFAAYDFWMKPLGLLYLSNVLKEKGHEVYLIDATYRHDNFYPEQKSDKYGRGKFYSVVINKFEVIKNIPRRYRRYGLPEEIIRERIYDYKPDAVMVTCTMTYWYPGVIEIKEILDSLHSNTILVLGGIYATLLPEHAKTIGYDNVYTLKDRYIEELDIKIPENFGKFPPPDHSHYINPGYAVLATSMGCPYKCPYCASPLLYQRKEDKEIKQVIEELKFLYKKGIKRFAFYDDALLVDEDRFLALCYGIKEFRINAKFFTPNGLHSSLISKEVAEAMQRTNFVEPRISLETTDKEIQKKLCMKTTFDDFKIAVDNLTSAGYDKKNIYTYLLAGLPEQSFDSVKKSILDVAKVGIKISLSEFSPIPNTPMDQELVDPLLTNNTAYYYYIKEEKEMERVKQLTKWVNKGIDLEISMDEIKGYL